MYLDSSKSWDLHCVHRMWHVEGRMMEEGLGAPKIGAEDWQW